MRKILNFIGWLCLIVMIALAAVLLVPRLLGMQSFAVLTGSMDPAVPVGTLVFTKPQASYAAGDIITFLDDNGIVVTHRVVSADADAGTYVTKGDANNVADPLPAEASNVIGRVVFQVPYLGAVSEKLKTRAGINIACGVILVLFLSILLPTVISDHKRTKGRHEIDPHSTN